MSDQTSMQLTSSAEDSRAKIYREPESIRLGKEKVSAESGVDYFMSLRGLWMSVVQSGLLLKTSPDSCHRTEGGIWEPSSGRWGNLGMGTPTECSTADASECPTSGAESSLSDILQDEQQVPEKYYLEEMKSGKHMVENRPDEVRSRCWLDGTEDSLLNG